MEGQQDIELDILDDDDDDDDDVKFRDLIYRLAEIDVKEEGEVTEEKDEGEEDEEGIEELKSESWIDPDTGKRVRGIVVSILPDRVIDVHGLTVMIPNKRHKDYFDVCPFCLKPWTTDKTHQISCLPCGHMFGMSCIQNWMEDRSSDVCPECHKGYSFDSVRLLYVNRLHIPAEASIRRFPYSKKGFNAFKQYELDLRADALNNCFDTLNQREDILRRQDNAIKRQAKYLKLMAGAEKRAEFLEQQADAKKEAEELRCRAEELRCRAEEYLEKAKAFGQQAKAMRQRAKALCQRIEAYTPSIIFFKQHYKYYLELLSLHVELTSTVLLSM